MVIPTQHIEAKLGDFAKTVLMPGDPLRAKFIAENFLIDVTQINGIRGMLGFTGTCDNKKVSVMASGMGIPSMCIYSYELFNFYNVENIIRIGTAGAISETLKLEDVIIGMGACTDINYSDLFNVSGYFSPIASYDLVSSAVRIAKKMNIPVKVGNVLSSAIFYNENSEIIENWRAMGVLAVEMEAAGLYMNAAKANKQALCICTISDILKTGEKTSSKQRQEKFSNMVKIALKTVN